MNELIPDTIKAFEQVVWLTEVHFQHGLLGLKERESILRTILTCLSEGFTKSETIHFVRCNKGCNPELTEEAALRAMYTIQADVYAREGYRRGLSRYSEEVTTWVRSYLGCEIKQGDLFLERDSRDTSRVQGE